MFINIFLIEILTSNLVQSKWHRYHILCDGPNMLSWSSLGVAEKDRERANKIKSY